MKAELTTIYDSHPDSPRPMWVTKDGLRFTQEQWALMQFMKRLEKKLAAYSRPHRGEVGE